MFKEIRFYLYEKDFIIMSSIGKMLAVGSILESVFTQSFHWSNSVAIVIGFILDILKDRVVDWWTPSNPTCPICIDGVLEKKEMKEQMQMDGKVVDLPVYNVLKCGNCEGELVDKNETTIVNSLKEKYEDKDGDEKCDLE